MIQKFVGRGENPDDLFQVGCIGLLKAVKNFDETKMVRFSTYGVPMIAGEIRRYLRDNSSIRVSRSVRDTAYRVLQCKEKMISEQQKEPTMEEIAEKLEIPVEDVIFAWTPSLRRSRSLNRFIPTVATADRDGPGAGYQKYR